MEITEATCRLLPYLQKMINPPVRFDPINLKATEDNYFYEKKSRAKSGEDQKRNCIWLHTGPEA